MPAVADIQNTIERAFAEDPRVVTAVMSHEEPRGDLEAFWDNVYLRGQMLFEPDGAISTDAYAQPDTSLPASRWFVVGPDETIVLPHFGYDPTLILDTVRGVLATMPPLGDMDQDGDVDEDDFASFVDCFEAGTAGPYCRLSDFDKNGVVDCTDWDRFARAWPASGAPLELAACSGTDPLELWLERAPGGTRVCWNGDDETRPYNVVRGALGALGLEGATVQLGPLACVERRSWDACTTGHEDAELPDPGAAFFYLVGRFEGEVEQLGGDSGGRPRVSPTADCVAAE